MENSMTIGRRIVAITVSAATILWAVGIATLAVPTTASAADMGDLIKGESLSTVYYYGYDGARYTFPNEKTFMTWFEDFDSVQEISDDDLADISLAGNVVYRPGARWIKIESNPKTYLVATDGSIHWIEDEDTAVAYAGDDWADNIDDVPDVFFVDFSDGASMASAAAFDGMLYMSDDAYYVAVDGESRMLSEDGRSANRYMDSSFLDGGDIDTSSLTAGDDIDAEVSALTDVAQQGGTTDDDTAASGGGVEMSVSSSTPSGATLPGGANSVEVFSFDVEAGDEAAEVDEIVAHLSSVGATTNISNAYLYEGSSRLTEAKSVNASTRNATFGSLSLELAAGETRTLTVRVEVSASQTAGDEIQFEIESADSVDANGGEVSGDFPLAGNTFTLASSDAGTFEIDKNGTISTPVLGEAEAVVGQFRAAASTEAASLEEITLKIDNSGDHSNFQLWDGSDLLADGEYLGSKLVKFDLSDDPFEIAEGSSNIFAVSLDVGGDASDNIGVYIDNAADVLAIGGDFGFGMTVDIATNGTYDGATACDATTDNCSFSTIDGGDVTIAWTGPSASDVAVNSQDVSLFEFSITAAQTVTIKDMDFIVYADDDDNDPFDGTDDASGAAASDDDGLINTNAEGNMSDFKVSYADGSGSLMGPLDLDSVATSGNDALQTIDFSDDFELAAGESLELVLSADIDNDLTSATELGATLDIDGLVIEDSNGDTLASGSIVPSGDVVGKTQTARASSLTLALSSTPGDITTVQGSDDINVVNFSIVSGDAGSATISSITIGAYADTNNSGFTKGDVVGADVNDFIESCSLYDASDNLLDGPKSPASGGATILFDDVDWTLEAGASEEIALNCNLGNPGGAVAYFAFDIDDASEDIVAEDEDGTDIDPLDSSGNAADDLNGSTTPTNVVTVNTAGTISVAAGASTPSADFIMTSSSDTHVASYDVTATNEDFVISTITFSEEQAEDDTGTANSSNYANNISLVTIEYPLEDGTTTTSTASLNGNEARFSSESMFVDTADEATVSVYVDVPSTDRVSGGSATSNEKIRMGFLVDATNDDGFKAVGEGSGTTLDDDDVSAVGDDASGTDGIYTYVVREAQPTITLSDDSPSGSGKIPGDQEVYRFNIAASANEDIVMEELIWKLASTDNGSTSWNLYDADDDGLGGDDIDTPDFDFYNMSEDGTSTALDTADVNWSVLTSDATTATDTIDTVNYVHLTLPTAEIIPAGTTYVYALWFDSTGASASNDDSIQFTLASDPIVSTSYLAASDLNESDLTATDTSLTVTSSAGYTDGDVLCMDTADDGCGSADERMLLVDVVDATTIEVVRGYLNTAIDSTQPGLNDAGDDVDRLPGAFLWQDDGTTAEGTQQETRWGSYLVDDLPVTGGAMLF